MTNVSSVTKHFPSAEEGFTTTLSSTISAGATTVGVNSLSGYTTGEVATFIVAPTVASEKQVFTGVVDTAGLQLTNVVWTTGTNQTHAAGTTVVDYATATHISQMSKGILEEHNQDGSHGAVTASSVTSSGAVSGTTGTFTDLAGTGIVDATNIADGAVTYGKKTAKYQLSSVSGNTNSTSTVDLSGSVTMSLDAGTYYVLVIMSGEMYNNTAGGTTNLLLRKNSTTLAVCSYSAGTGDNDKGKGFCLHTVTTAVNGDVFKPSANVSSGSFGGFPTGNSILSVIVLGK